MVILKSIVVDNTGVNKVKTKEIPYTEFNQMVKNDKIEEVNINLTLENFTAITKEKKSIKVPNPRYGDFKKDLLTSGVKVNEVKPSTIPPLLMSLALTLLPIMIIMYFLRPMLRSQMSAIKTGDSKKVTDVPNINFSHIAGNEESKLDMLNLVNFLKRPDEYQKMGAKLPKGVILQGPPGTGKTLTAKAIAGEANVPFFSVSGSDFIEMYAGLGAKRVRDLFADAKKHAPCIIFIDEIDAIGSKRTNSANSNEHNQTINALLSEMDGFASKESVIVIAATNRIESLDSALIRPGRFDRHISIELPDKDDRRKILNNYLANKTLADDVDIEELATLTIGFSGAGLESLINESAIHAVNRKSNKIYYEDIDEAFYKIVMKGSKKTNKKDKDKEELKLIAYHEAGHALCAKILTDNSIPKVTIVPSTSGAGGVTFNIPKKRGLLTKNEILNNIKVLYAGRASEFILRGDNSEITTGASQDINQATQYIKGYFESYGMSDEFGMLDLNTLSKDIDITGEAIKLSKQLYDETLELLKNNKATLIAISNRLIDQETLNEEELDSIINNR